MMFKLLTFAAILLSAKAQECQEIETVENFNITLYASAPWYIHEQAVTRYSPIDQNFCTRALYSIRNSKYFWGYTVDVNNEAQNVGGEQFGGPLCAYQEDNSPSKLAVAPCFLPKFFAGPYWIVAYNETEGYALISGGQPTVKGEDGGCRTGTGTNNSGLWIFSRSQERDEDLIKRVRTIAKTAGFDLTVLNFVEQDGCLYEDADEDEDGSLGCVDQEDTFKVWYGAERDCNWVKNWSSLRCVLYKDHCPNTCNDC